MSGLKCSDSATTLSTPSLATALASATAYSRTSGWAGHRSVSEPRSPKQSRTVTSGWRSPSVALRRKTVHPWSFMDRFAHASRSPSNASRWPGTGVSLSPSNSSGGGTKWAPSWRRVSLDSPWGVTSREAWCTAPTVMPRTPYALILSSTRSTPSPRRSSTKTYTELSTPRP